MKNLAILPRTVRCTVSLLTLVFSATGLAQSNWQLITQPPINYISSVGVRSNDVNQILLSGEHDGEWNNSSDPNTLRWAFTVAGNGYLQVHGTRYLAAPAMAQNVYFLDLHGTMFYFVLRNGAMVWGEVPINVGNEDGFYALAIDPNNSDPAGQRVLMGGPGVIKFSDVGTVPTNCFMTRCWTQSTINGMPNLVIDAFITDIQYAPMSSSVAWAATSEAAGWDDVPAGPVPPPGIQPRHCSGVMRTSNADSTNPVPNWVILDSLPGDANCVRAVAPISTTQVYAATKAGLWKGTYNSINGTTSWSEIVFPSPVFGGQKVSSLFYPSPVGSLTTLYVGLARPPPATNGVYKGTTTDGQNWTWANTSFPNTVGVNVNALAGLPMDASTFYGAFSNGEVRKTINYGQNTNLLQGQHAGYPIATVAVPPGQPNDNTIYVGTTCQGGVYRGVYNFSWGWTTQTKPALPGFADFHSHFHYVMRLAQDSSTAGNMYVTEDAYVFTTADGGAHWTRTFPTTCSPQPCGVHVHGLAVAPMPVNPPYNTLYVGSGHGNWPGYPFSDSPTGLIWRSTDSGSSWLQVGNADNFPGTSSTCDKQVNPPIESGCYSVYTIAVSPNDPNRVFVGTFGHENYAGETYYGTAIGVVRGSLNSQTQQWTWQLLNDGLCPNVGACGGSPPAGAQSLYIGTVATDNSATPANVYIATFNGIYKMPENGTTWVDISPSFSVASFPPGTCDFNDCRRFESIAVSGNVLLAGTSQRVVSPHSPIGDGDRPAKIFKSTNGGATWTVWWMPDPPPVSRAWAEQYRVRDIKMGSIKAYAAIEGSGIYRMDIVPATQRPGR